MSWSKASHVFADARQARAMCPYCHCETVAGQPVSVCNECGAVHHSACWAEHGRCGAYACSPAKREIPAGADVMQIGSDDLASIRPAPVPTRAVAAGRWAAPPVERARLSRLAVWAFVVAVIGIPAFGLVTGLMAIILGAAALSAMSGTRLRGTGWAVAALVLGVCDMAGWLVLLNFWYGSAAPLNLVEFQPDMAALSTLNPQINRAMRANVLVESQRGSVFPRQAIGSGVILRIENGEALVITNRHVVAAGSDEPSATLDELNAGRLSVKVIGQLTQPARVVWAAPDTIDAVLIRVVCHSTEALAADWPSSDPMHVGDPVFAIGNPHNLGWTHTQGTISQFRTQGNGLGRIRIIQTQTAINPGNSGGGLYSNAGKLIGINTWTNDKRVSEGISFAIAFESVLALHPPMLEPAAAKTQGGAP